MMIALLLTTVATQTVISPSDAARPDADVTVTARRSADLARQWRDCVATKCPPKTEMSLALAYAESQLTEGDYRGSWRTLRNAKARNMQYAEELPVEVAQIARATSRLAGLNGDPAVSRIAAVSTVDALKSGFANDDARVLMGQLHVGDAFVPEGRNDAALAQYRRVAGKARKLGLPEVAALADFRRARLMTGLSSTKGGYQSSARRALDKIIASRDPAMERYRDPARLVKVNLLPADKQPGAMMTVIQTLKPRPAEDLLLVHAPMINPAMMVLTPVDPSSAQQWITLDYQLAADGTVRDVIARQQSRFVDPELKAAAIRVLGQRRYAPIALRPDETIPVRSARYTFVFDVEAPGTVSNRSDRAKQTEAVEPFRTEGNGDAAQNTKILPYTGEIATRIPRYGTVPRVDVFDLGTTLARKDYSTS